MPSSLAFPRKLSTLALAGLCALLAGCGAGNFDHASPIVEPVSGTSGGGSIQGTAHGGQQPVVGAALQLYAANPGAYGGPTAPLLPAGSFVTNSGGGFNISGQYTCPTPDAPVYLVASGGNPGLSANNPNLAEMAALGSCSALKANAATTFIQMNELTTVGAVYALAPFMSGVANLGTSPQNSLGLNLAFADVNALVNNATGAASGPALPAGATLPVAELNTLADILATCINSAGGTAGDQSACGKLFSAATPSGGAAPTDTVTAALDIVQHPGQNVALLFGRVPPGSPFQPTLSSAPNDWTLAVTYRSIYISAPSAVAIDAAANVWITNPGTGSATEFSHAGNNINSQISLGYPSAIAIDATGAPWVTDKSDNVLFHLSQNSTNASGGGLNAPAGIAIDPQGNLWIANSGSNSVSEFTSTGAAITGASGYTGSGIVRPLGIALSAH